ncbi:MAG TPA: phage tail protein [Bryocella sp.]|nr:phage tail protein [Bryocella sp.]
MSGFDIGVNAAMGVASTAMSVAGALGLLPRIDPALAHSFTVEIDGIIVGGFSEVTGLTMKTDVWPVPQGGQNRYTEQRINGSKFENLVLKRGITTADMLWLWHRDVMTGKIERHSGSIVLMTKDLAELWRWNFRDAFPVKWIGPGLRADQSAVAVEQIELVHRGISKDAGPLGGGSIGGMMSAGVIGGASFL